MTEDKPEGLQIATVRQVICCERVPEKVRVQALNPACIFKALEYLLDQVVRASFPVLIDEERLGSGSAVTIFQTVI